MLCYEIRKILRIRQVLLLFSALLIFNFFSAAFRKSESMEEQERYFRNHYDMYVENTIRSLQEQSETVLSLDSDKYTVRNCQSAVSAYEKLTGKNISGRVAQDISACRFSAVSEYLLLAVIAVITLLSMKLENDAMTVLLHTLQNVRRIYFLKMILLSLISFGLYICMAAENYLIGIIRYGASSLSLPIQCIPGFLTSPLDTDIAGFIVMQLALRFLWILSIVSLILFITLLFRKFIPACSAVLAIGLLSYAGSRLIGQWSVFAPVKYALLFSEMHSEAYFSQWTTLDMAGFPVPVWIYAALINALRLVILYFFGEILWMHNLPFDRRKEYRLSRSEEKYHSLTALECKKFFLHEGMILLLILFATVQFAIYSHKTYGKSEEEYYYELYSARLEGNTPDECSAKIEKRKQEIQKEEAELDKLQEDSGGGEVSDSYITYRQEKLQVVAEKEDALHRIEEQVSWLKKQSERGFYVTYIMTTPYDVLLGQPGEIISGLLGMYIFILIGVLASPFYEKKSGVVLLFAGSPESLAYMRKIRRRILYLYVILCWLIASLPRILWVERTFHVTGWSEPAAGLRCFAGVPFLSVQTAIIAAELIKLVIGIGLCTIENSSRWYISGLPGRKKAER